MKDFDNYLKLYEQVHETHRYEGNGIWSRFSIMISLNVILLGLLAFSQNQGLLIVVCIVGVLFSLLAIRALNRLWKWHSHWCDTLKEMEQHFPIDFPKPFSTTPKSLNNSKRWFRPTQPFLFVLCLMWFALFILTIIGVLPVNSNNQY